MAQQASSCRLRGRWRTKRTPRCGYRNSSRRPVVCSDHFMAGIPRTLGTRVGGPRSRHGARRSSRLEHSTRSHDSATPIHAGSDRTRLCAERGARCHKRGIAPRHANRSFLLSDALPSNLDEPRGHCADCRLHRAADRAARSDQAINRARRSRQVKFSFSAVAADAILP
jgi:hypothetical protein